jgi:hypothetical protein
MKPWKIAVSYRGILQHRPEYPPVNPLSRVVFRCLRGYQNRCQSFYGYPRDLLKWMDVKGQMSTGHRVAYHCKCRMRTAAVSAWFSRSTPSERERSRFYWVKWGLRGLRDVPGVGLIGTKFDGEFGKLFYGITAKGWKGCYWYREKEQAEDAAYVWSVVGGAAPPGEWYAHYDQKGFSFDGIFADRLEVGRDRNPSHVRRIRRK